MAVAGLHKASMLDSYVGENHSPASRRCCNKEKPTTRTSSIRKMWRDLESEGRVGQNGKRPESPCLSSLETESMESEETLGDANEIENECPQNQNQTVVQNGQEDVNKSCLQRSPSLDVPAKERVRKVFRDWGNKSFEGRTLYSSRMNNCSRAQYVGENECKRVRIVREWIELSGQQGGTCQTSLDKPATEIGSQTGQVQDGSVDLGVGVQKSIRRIYGRQALLDLLAKFVREREREVNVLLQNQFVSNFAQRHRIQTLLKGRFLRNQRFVEDEKQTSVAASELGLLRQTHAVSDIRKGFLSKLNNYDKNAPEVAQSNSDDDNIEEAEEIIHEIPHEIGEEFETTNLTSNQEAYAPQQFSLQVGERRESHLNILQYEERDILPPTVEFTETRSQNQDDSMDETYQNTYHFEFQQGTLGTESITHGPQLDEVVRLHPLQTSTDSLNWQEISQAEEEWQESITEDDDSEWHHLTHTNSDEGVDVNSPVRSGFQESQEEWYENLQDETPESGMTMFRSNAFYWSDDDNDNSFELTELTNRRRVSNLLQSEFGPRLDQLLMQSYVNRQNQAFESENEAVDSPSAVILQTQDREIINGLRVDMDTLQERMNEMQRMLEACMDMQLELQKSMQQELYSSLIQSSCYLCCDDGFESLPDHRSGSHMYICSKCGEKINWSKIKESVRHP